MEIIDGHSHMYHARAAVGELKQSVADIDGFDLNRLLERLEDIGVSRFQTMAQSMERIRGMWLGSNELAVSLSQLSPTRIISFAAAEPLDAQDRLNTDQLDALDGLVKERGIKGLLLARNLAMAREYGVLDRVFYGSDYVGESIDAYLALLHRELAYIRDGLNRDLEVQGFEALTDADIEGFFSKNVLRLWKSG